jgi:rhodanese-related sulfurtransferase
MRKNILLVLISSFFITLCAGCQKNYTDLDVPAFAKVISAPDDSVTLVDVRTQAEYNEGHIKGAININVFDDSFMSVVHQELDTLRPVAVYCKTGRRSTEAAARLSRIGFKVFNLDGGINAWIKAKQPVVK